MQQPYRPTSGPSDKLAAPSSSVTSQGGATLAIRVARVRPLPAQQGASRSPPRRRVTTSYEARVNLTQRTSRDWPHGDRLKDVGTYEFRVRRTHRNTTPDHAIRRARELAFADGVTVFGDPVVNSRRVPIPVIGPRREFVVTFPRATRRGDRSQRVAEIGRASCRERV